MHSNACDKYNSEDQIDQSEYVSWENYKTNLTNFLESRKIIKKSEFIDYSIVEYNNNNYVFPYDLTRLNNFYYYWKSNNIKYTNYYL